MKIKNFGEVFTVAVIFAAMFLFFSQVHPITPFDGDDWNVISDARPALPKWGGWNPIKILPETFYPICGYIAAYVVAPIIGDYLSAITVTAALILSLFIAAYILLFIEFVKKIFRVDSFLANLTGIIFLLLHFALFLRHNAQDNIYLFHTIDANCYFNYVIPNLLNAALVLLIAQFDITRNIFDNVTPRSVALFFAFYLGIFSNILNSSLLGVFVFVELLSRFIDLRSRVEWKNFRLKKFFDKNKSLCMILIFWLISLLFEANGGRAKNFTADGGDYFANVIQTAAAFFDSISHNHGLGLMIFSIVTVIFILTRRNDYEPKIFLNVAAKFAACIPLLAVYTILVAARADINYATRADVQFGLFFCTLIIFCMTLLYWLKKFPRAAFILPILCFALFTWIFSGKRSFSPSTFGNVPEKICAEISQSIINQIVAADRAGLDEVTVTVPKGDDIDNWPHPLYMGKNISRTLCNHGIISRRIKVIFVPDVRLNALYSLPIK